MYYKDNNKGFSLIEMLIAVVIVSVLSIPVVFAFTTGANTSSKARRISSSNLAATNMIECIDAIGGCDDFLELNDSAKTVIKNTFDVSDSAITLSGKTVKVTNLKVGSSYYDGEMIFSATDNAVKSVNETELVQMPDVDGFFAQTDEYDCDSQADKDSKITDMTGVSKSRTIDIEYTGVFANDSDNVPKSVNMTISFTYIFTKNGEQVFTKTYSYYILSAFDYDANDPPKVYVSYNPYYANAVEKININIGEKVDGRIFLIKSKTDNSTDANESSLPINLSVHIPNTHYDVSQSKTVANTKEDGTKMVYTNADLNVYDTSKKINSFNYTVVVGYRSYTTDDYNSSLLETQAIERLYNITVNIYPKDTFASGSYGSNDVITTYTAVKMK